MIQLQSLLLHLRISHTSFNLPCCFTLIKSLQPCLSIFSYCFIKKRYMRHQQTTTQQRITFSLFLLLLCLCTNQKRIVRNDQGYLSVFSYYFAIISMKPAATITSTAIITLFQSFLITSLTIIKRYTKERDKLVEAFSLFLLLLYLSLTYLGNHLVCFGLLSVFSYYFVRELF